MHKLALWIGCLLLLLAAVTFAANDDTVSSEWSSQRLRVQQVLAGSAPCVTCHTAVSETPRLLIETGHADRATYAPPATLSPTGIEPVRKTANAHATAEKVSVGARLLAVPARDLAAYTAAVDLFVSVSEALDQADSFAAQGEALRALDLVARRVLALEQQANSYRLTVVPDGFAPDAEPAASAPPAPPLLVALVVALVTIAPVAVAVCRRETGVCFRPQRFVAGARRRGPPLGDCCRLLDSGRGRLRPSVAQSLFSCSKFGCLVFKEFTWERRSI